MPIHKSRINLIKFTFSYQVSNLNQMITTIFCPSSQAFFCTYLLTPFFFWKSCFIHFALGVHDPHVILGSNLCLWSLKSSTSTTWWVKTLGSLELEGTTTILCGKLVCLVSLHMTPFLWVVDFELCKLGFLGPVWNSCPWTYPTTSFDWTSFKDEKSFVFFMGDPCRVPLVEILGVFLFFGVHS